MKFRKKPALIGLLTTGGGAYGVYELVDKSASVFYSLDIPVKASFEVAEELESSTSAIIPDPNTSNVGIQPSISPSETVATNNPSSKNPVSKDEEVQKDLNQDPNTQPSVVPVTRPAESGDSETLQTKTNEKDKLEMTIVSSPEHKPTSEGGSEAAPKSKAKEEVKPQAPKVADATKVASSYGLTYLESYDAQGIDRYSENNSAATKVKTYVKGEDAEYISTLWTSSIAIKHRKYWNLAPDDDESWDRQLATAQARFHRHALAKDGSSNSKLMYAYVFGNFTIDKEQEDIYQTYPEGTVGNIRNYHDRPKMPLLNKYNLARTCKQNLERTPWGTWFSGGRSRYWILLWDFCANEEWQKKGIPGDIDYWYRDSIGPRDANFFKSNK